MTARRGEGRPEVSVVVVARNAREELIACLSSLERDAGLPFETIVVDDGSQDGTATAVRERFPSAHLVAKDRSEGLVAGRNDALPHVRGRLVLMLDADTEVGAGALPTLAAALDEDPARGLVGPKLVYPDGSLQLSCRRFPPLLIPLIRRGPYARFDPDPLPHRRHLMKDFDHASARPVVWVSGAAQMWRADLPARIGRYDRLLSSYGGEDIDWCLRTWRSGLEVRYVPSAKVVHREQRMTRARPFGRDSLHALRDWYYLQWKHRSLRRDPRLAEARR